MRLVIPQDDRAYQHAARLRLDRSGSTAEAEHVVLETTRWTPSATGPSAVRTPVDTGIYTFDVVGSDLKLASAEFVSAVLPENDRVARARTASVEVVSARGLARVVLVQDVAEGATRRDLTVFEARGIAAAPTILETRDGWWVAFHHDVREDTGEADITKWIAVRFVTRTGQVLEPSAEMTDRSRDREGEEQGFEFPSLVLGPNGALILFGRGSHAFYRQELTSVGWAPRTALSVGGWGCRGRRVSVVARGDVLWTARREREGIVVETFPAPHGTDPALVPCKVSLVGSKSAVFAVAGSRSKLSDPAERWGRRTLFGDIHQHSAHSDGCGSADEPYLRARYRYGDDFCALTDHESFLGKRIGPDEWTYLKSVADAHNEPGRFATLHAYEWTGKSHPGPGHKVVYATDSAMPIFSRDTFATGQALSAELRKWGAFAVPHHVGWTGADENAHTEDVQPVFEICSCHGCYETWKHDLGQRGDLRDQMVDSVLSRGLRFGFIASSDGHGLLFHHGVARKRDPFRTGLTAAVAKATTREAILSAIRERRCYATSGAKILLDLTVDDAPMGTCFSSRAKRSIHAETYGEGAVARIELIGPDGVLAAANGSNNFAAVDVRADVPYVYARVTQSDGEYAWSSPVFAGEGP